MSGWLAPRFEFEVRLPGDQEPSVLHGCDPSALRISRSLRAVARLLLRSCRRRPSRGRTRGRCSRRTGPPGPGQTRALSGRLCAEGVGLLRRVLPVTSGRSTSSTLPMRARRISRCQVPDAGSTCGAHQHEHRSRLQEPAVHAVQREGKRRHCRPVLGPGSHHAWPGTTRVSGARSQTIPDGEALAWRSDQNAARSSARLSLPEGPKSQISGAAMQGDLEIAELTTGRPVCWLGSPTPAWSMRTKASCQLRLVPGWDHTNRSCSSRRVGRPVNVSGESHTTHWSVEPGLQHAAAAGLGAGATDAAGATAEASAPAPPSSL
jgi:hypothetical protein